MKTKLEELCAALEAATNGEWIESDGAVLRRKTGFVLAQFYPAGGEAGDYRHNATFIALAHNLMPALLEAVELLKAYNKASDLQFATDSELHESAKAVLEKLK